MRRCIGQRGKRKIKEACCAAAAFEDRGKKAGKTRLGWMAEVEKSKRTREAQLTLLYRANRGN